MSNGLAFSLTSVKPEITYGPTLFMFCGQNVGCSCQGEKSSCNQNVALGITVSLQMSVKAVVDYSYEVHWPWLQHFTHGQMLINGKLIIQF